MESQAKQHPSIILITERCYHDTRDEVEGKLLQIVQSEQASSLLEKSSTGPTCSNGG